MGDDDAAETRPGLPNSRTRGLGPRWRVSEPVRVYGAAQDGSHDMTTLWHVPDDRVSGGSLCFVDDASHP